MKTTLISTETRTHVPSPWYGQYRTHAHNHITRAVAAMDSCFALVGAHQHGIAVGSRSGSKPAHRDPLLPRRVHSTPLSASSTVGKCMRTVLAIPRGWYVCLSADKCWLQFILSTQVCKWSHPHTHCRGRTVLRLPTNSTTYPNDIQTPVLCGVQLICKVFRQTAPNWGCASYPFHNSAVFICASQYHTKVDQSSTLINYNIRKQRDEPIGIRSKYAMLRKCARDLRKKVGLLAV